MAKRILIDSSHPEETRVVVLAGNRLEDFDFETPSRKQLKGNIYLAKITRVEPSLQAAFVDYGGNRHGFLPFSEIHPDYYRIPIADREALLAEEAALRSEAADEAPDDVEVDGEAEPAAIDAEDSSEEDGADAGGDMPAEIAAAPDSDVPDGDAPDNREDSDQENGAAGESLETDTDDSSKAREGADPEEVEVEQSVDTVGGDEAEEAAQRRAKLMRRYKIQEVIKRRQVILVQVTKEERGNKGAALTSYLSLPGRYCVLMPNTNKGGGISRKISNASDRRRLKQILNDLEIPEGIAVIVRTAGSQRTKVEIRRDYEYLLRLWNTIREQTLDSTAPALIYEEANLIKRSIRDLYSRDMEEVLVDGEESYKAAKDFMKSLTPSHAKKVQQYKDSEVPLFQRFQVESQLDAMHSNTVQLRSGGYLVLNQTEALVAIDVNSGRATRERHIEETALKTNLEAAEEIGRQLRLRDLAGLIVIDFIDMEESRRNREVERRLKESLRSDRARIQLGRISPFGLLEMSRQRLRSSLFESSTEICPHCAGEGRVRTVESLALQVLRRLEEEGARQGDAEIVVMVPSKVALYILNKKRDHLIAIEQRHDFRISIEADDHITNDAFVIERDGVATERRRVVQEDSRSGDSEDGDRKRGRRRRGGNSRRRKDEDQFAAEERDNQPEAERESDGETDSEDTEVREVSAEEQDDERQRKRKRRGKRGGRRRSRRRGEEGENEGVEAASDSGDGAAESETSDAEAADATGAAADDSDASVSQQDAGADAEEVREEKPKRRRSTRQRRGSKKSDPEASEAAPQEAAEAEGEEKPKRAPRRRSTTRGRGTGRGAKTAKSDAATPETAQPETAQSETAGQANGGAAPAPGDPQAMIADDPKVVIEPVKPTSTAMPVETDAPVLEQPAVEPQGGGEDQDDQPKRRGWWNRFI
ncbi:Rne/Rng family ribonuclease [Pelagibius litoralis]|uniref:Ribonuclease E n=1 Tax=Pelagibius litoralis TaxID=374515 RepID=A0A967EVN8_9PROT|nr:ribonuclease E/G [Pelagibius litoralis]NIA68777.1 Rne/Rng family ribonuclease [Pelagibius litoralis]